jgi:hypothetical protein
MKRSVILASALFVAAPAHAYPTMFGGDCDTPQGCLIGLPEDANDLYIGFDWTIPDDGVTYKWTFTVDQPGAKVYVPGANQVEFYSARKTATGVEDAFSFESFPYRFDGFHEAGSNVTTYFVHAPKGKPYTCGTAAVGEVCFLYYRVWNNGQAFQWDGTSGPFNMRIAVQAVPEPATWALMIAGFGVAGAAARRRRAALA